MPGKVLKAGDSVTNPTSGVVYVIEDEVSVGGMARSYRASASGKTVFFKDYKSPTPTLPWYAGYVAYQAELKRRIETSDLRNFTYRILDFFEAEKTPGRPATRTYFQVFEWVDRGHDLATAIARMRERRSPASWEQRLIWAKVITGSLNQLHQQRIAHIDLKPENLMLFEDPTIRVGYRLKIIDMDFSILTDRQAPWHGQSGYAGTPGWWSPEHLSGAVPGAASDVFTTGLILYELLADGNPYAGLEQDAYLARLRAHAAPKPRLAGPVGDVSATQEILHLALHPNPGNRPTAQQINDVLKATPVVAPVPVPVPRPRVPVPPPPERGTAGGSDGPAPTPTAATLILRAESGTTLQLGITTRIARRNVRGLGDDSRFWSDDWQFTMERTEGGWRIVPNPGATNETLLNSKALKAPHVLRSGEVIAVGRESKGIAKLPLKVDFG